MGYLALSDETWAQVVVRISESPGWITVRWAAVRQADGRWRLEVASVRAEEKIEPRRLDYGGLLMGIQSYEPTEAAALLARGAVTPDSELGTQLSFVLPTQAVRPTYHTTETHDVYSSRSGWPEYVLRVDLDRGYSGQGLSSLDHLVSPGLPLYPNSEAAVADVVFAVAPEMLRRDISRYLEIRLADRRGRITRLSSGRRRVKIHLEGCAEGFSLRVAWRERDAPERWHDTELATELSPTLQTRGLPLEFWAYLCSSSGAVIDRHGWAPNQAGERPNDPELSVMVVRRLAREGEGTALEYKLKLGERMTNERLAKTICAFANGNGGRVLIGVGDEGEIQGFAGTKVRDQITDIVRANIDPSPTLTLRSLRVDRKPIYVVSVLPGGDRPYRCRGRVMVRLQATTREASAAEIREIVNGMATLRDPLTSC